MVRIRIRIRIRNFSEVGSGSEINSFGSTTLKKSVPSEQKSIAINQILFFEKVNVYAIAFLYDTFDKYIWINGI